MSKIKLENQENEKNTQEKMEIRIKKQKTDSEKIQEPPKIEEPVEEIKEKIPEKKKEKPKMKGLPPPVMTKNGKKIGRPRTMVFMSVKCVFHMKSGEKYEKKFKCLEGKEDHFSTYLLDTIERNKFYYFLIQTRPLKVVAINVNDILKIEMASD